MKKQTNAIKKIHQEIKSVLQNKMPIQERTFWHGTIIRKKPRKK